jgi:ubiquinone/menaquinone biosynthesis C-methylase UbiE
MNKNKPVKSEYVQDNFLGLPERFSLKIRRKMFDSLMKFAGPSPATLVLDVGVTCDRRKDSNFFEKLYPYTGKITAIGQEDCRFLEKDFPGLKFLQTDGTRLPFQDKSFDLAVSFATIEHVGNRQRQKDFISELSRVSRLCCITTPNRWFPLEFHSITPFIHWLPPALFRTILRCMGKSFYAKEENLNLLSQKDMMSMMPPDKEVHVETFRFCGFVSNLMFYIKNTPS